MRKLGLAVELAGILAVAVSFFAGGARFGWFGAGVTAIAAAAALGGFAPRRSMPAFWLWFSSLAVYAFLYIPLAIVVVFSFNDSKLNAEWVGFTASWYERLFANESMLAAAGNSLLIAIVASGIATVLGRWPESRSTGSGRLCCRFSCSPRWPCRRSCSACRC